MIQEFSSSTERDSNPRELAFSIIDEYQTSCFVESDDIPISIMSEVTKSYFFAIEILVIGDHSPRAEFAIVIEK